MNKTIIIDDKTIIIDDIKGDVEKYDNLMCIPIQPELEGKFVPPSPFDKLIAAYNDSSITLEEVYDNLTQDEIRKFEEWRMEQVNDNEIELEL